MGNPEVVADSPEKFAKFSHFLVRQFSKITPITKDDVNLKGQTMIVTGANSGVGLEVCKHLLDLGLTRLIMACRNEARANAARTLLAANRGPNVQIDVWSLNLSSYNSIAQFADQCKTLDRLDSAILSAGVSNEILINTPDTGAEEMFQINYLSNTLLCILLLPIFQNFNQTSPPEAYGRLVVVSSDMAAWAQLPATKKGPLLPPFKQPLKFDRSTQYGISKLFGQVFVSELMRRVPSTADFVRLANPGLCRETGMAAESKTFSGRALFYTTRVLGRDPAVGAITLVSAAANTDWGSESQDKLVDCNKLAP